MIRGRRDMRKAQDQHRRRQQQQAYHAEQDSHPLISRPSPSQAANHIDRAPETSRGDESLPFPLDGRRIRSLVEKRLGAVGWGGGGVVAEAIKPATTHLRLQLARKQASYTG